MQATPLCGGRSQHRFLSRSANPAESVAEEQHTAFTQRCWVRCTGLGDARRVENLLMQGWLRSGPVSGIPQHDLARDRETGTCGGIAHTTVSCTVPFIGACRPSNTYFLHNFRSSMPSAIVKLE